ncbi:hypothetical protein LJB85_00510 [Porphyromonadaceae bacterium OttesenSCG-928-L07]|nr:hypothetical protein [Porphyromonadaceae bacterium OttesenSCG-928-L07]
MRGINKIPYVSTPLYFNRVEKRTFAMNELYGHFLDSDTLIFIETTSQFDPRYYLSVFYSQTGDIRKYTIDKTLNDSSEFTMEERYVEFNSYEGYTLTALRNGTIKKFAKVQRIMGRSSPPFICNISVIRKKGNKYIFKFYRSLYNPMLGCILPFD